MSVHDDLPPFGEPWTEADDQYEANLQFHRDVEYELDRLRVRHAAQEAFKAEQTPPGDPFDAGTLAELLARPADPPMRIDGLIPSDGGTLLVAQRKTGKTTMILNHARSLITGEDFLGRFTVRPVDGNVALLNYEVSGHTIARWADEHGIDQDRLVVVNLRGRRNPLSHPEDRARLVAYLRGLDVEAITVDPFGRAYTGSSQNDAGEVGSWLVDLDVFVRSEVGATDLVLAAHAGWNGERTRGASALEDWADVILTMTKDDDDQRYLRAIGRDVELDEDRLDFDVLHRRLTLSGTGSRQAATTNRKLAELAVLVVRAVRHHKGEVTGRAQLELLIKGMDDNPGFRSGEVAKAAELAATNGHLTIEDHGAGRPKTYRLTEATP